jgi:hypothetical protein
MYTGERAVEDISFNQEGTEEMRANLIHAFIWAAVGYCNGWVWGDQILKGIRLFFSRERNSAQVSGCCI